MYGKLPIPILTTLFVLSGCIGDSNPTNQVTGQVTNLATGEQPASGLEFQLPAKIRTSLAVDFSQVTGFANVNGRNYEMERFGDRYRALVPNVPVNSDVSIDLLFSERLSDGRVLELARTNPQSFTVGTADQTIEISEEQYSYDFDADNDQISNIAERNDGTDPFTPENAGTRTITVEFNLPQRIEDPAITRVIALVADVPRPRTPRADNVVQVSGLVPASSTIDIDIRLTQQFDGEAVLIARATDQIDAGSDDFTLNLSDENFDFSIDDDGDGISNIDEIQAGSNPFGR